MFRSHGSPGISPRALAAIVGVISGLLAWLGAFLSPPWKDDFAEQSLLHAAAAFLEIAVTVGLIDFVLEQRAAREVSRAAIPLSTALEQNLDDEGLGFQQVDETRNADSVYVYRSNLDEALSAADDFAMVVAFRKPELAGQLGQLAKALRKQLRCAEDLYDGLRNNASNVPHLFEALKTARSSQVDIARDLEAVVHAELGHAHRQSRSEER